MSYFATHLLEQLEAALTDTPATPFQVNAAIGGGYAPVTVQKAMRHLAASGRARVVIGDNGRRRYARAVAIAIAIEIPAV